VPAGAGRQVQERRRRQARRRGGRVWPEASRGRSGSRGTASAQTRALSRGGARGDVRGPADGARIGQLATVTWRDVVTVTPLKVTLNVSVRAPFGTSREFHRNQYVVPVIVSATSV
jgi:hypothetical protein